MLVVHSGTQIQGVNVLMNAKDVRSTCGLMASRARHCALEPVKTGKGGADKNETFYHLRLKCTHGTAGGGVREGSRTGDGQENQKGMQPLVAATEAIASQTLFFIVCSSFSKLHFNSHREVRGQGAGLPPRFHCVDPSIGLKA